MKYYIHISAALIILISACSRKSNPVSATTETTETAVPLAPKKIKPDYLTGRWQMTEYEQKGIRPLTFMPFEDSIAIEITDGGILEYNNGALQSFTYSLEKNIMTVYNPDKSVYNIIFIETLSKTDLNIISKYTSDNIRIKLKKRQVQ